MRPIAKFSEKIVRERVRWITGTVGYSRCRRLLPVHLRADAPLGSRAVRQRYVWCRTLLVRHGVDRARRHPYVPGVFFVCRCVHRARHSFVLSAAVRLAYWPLADPCRKA